MLWLNTFKLAITELGEDSEESRLDILSEIYINENH